MGLLEDIQKRLEATESGLTALKKQVEEARALRSEDKPVMWLSKADARKYFLNNGKPISHSTMGEWVEQWLLEGVLVVGENCLVGKSGKVMISVKFLMDKSKQKQ